MLYKYIYLIFAIAFQLSTTASAQSVMEFVPSGAANCDLAQPPASAGVFVTPGGFLMAYPRNASLGQDYTGCKVLWIVETEQRYLKLATLYFKNGQLTVAMSHDFRNAPEKLEAACAFPQGKSLLPNSGRKIEDKGCVAFPSEDIFGIHTPTWPRQCAEDPTAKICQAEPN